MLRGLARARWAGVRARTGFGAVVLTILYGASDELHQGFVPGRTPEAADLAVAAIAATAIVGVSWAWSIIRSSRAQATRRAGHAAPASTERLP